ncbi:MAG: ribonuclease R [Gemmatimonadota bacterium]|nr:ribonuclease R [Gemmatimonadota bacterium]
MSITRDRVLDYIRSESERPLKPRELSRALRVAENDYRRFRRLLVQLEREGAIVRLRNNRFGSPERRNLAAGLLSVNPDGFGFVRRDDGKPDVFVGPGGLRGALHGDRVVVRLSRRRGGKPEGEISRVLERGARSIVGIYRAGTRFSFVEPDDPRIPRDLHVSSEDAGGARDGQLVVARLRPWLPGHADPQGEVVEVLGQPGDPGIDTLSIIKEYDLPIEFPSHVLAAAEAFPDRIPHAETHDRLDLRDLHCVTIDPEDARDHDDAVSLEDRPEGGYRLGVHIADVDHYVREGGPLDHEAMARGTSVYLADRAIPMLPERLSGNLCSLLPDEDRLAVSVLIDLDANGRPMESRIAPSVVRSRARLSYRQAQRLLNGSGSSHPAPHAAVLRKMDVLRRRIAGRRMKRGAIDFNIAEPRIVVDGAGRVTEIRKSERLDSHRIIEEFMLLANETVARRLRDRNLPVLYRIHEKPDAQKLAEFADTAAAFGMRFPRRDRITAADIQKFLAAVEGKRFGQVLNARLLQSMKKAVYSPDNVGHFGLACDTYTHFTSPIRRYPDLMVHRLLKEAAGLTEERKNALRERLPLLGDVVTGRESVAQEAERASVKVKQIRFLEDRVGDAFDAVIVGVRSIGFFAELNDFLIDGLVRVSTIGDDYYVYHEREGALIGQRSGRRFRLGDPVVVQLVRADRRFRRLDFLLMEGGSKAERGRSDRRKNGRRRRRRG